MTRAAAVVPLVLAVASFFMASNAQRHACTDTRQSCSAFARKGACTSQKASKSPGFTEEQLMAMTCAKSCNKCPTTTTTATSTTTATTTTTTTIEPVTIEFALDFDQTDLGGLEELIRTMLHDNGITEWRTAPIAFARGSIIASIFFSSQDNANALAGNSALLAQLTSSLENRFTTAKTTPTTTTTTVAKPTCSCKDSWDYNGNTFSGCAVATAEDPAWCYVKDAACADATESSHDSSLAWANCKQTTTTTATTTTTTTSTSTSTTTKTSTTAATTAATTITITTTTTTPGTATTTVTSITPDSTQTGAPPTSTPPATITTATTTAKNPLGGVICAQDGPCVNSNGGDRTTLARAAPTGTASPSATQSAAVDERDIDNGRGGGDVTGKATSDATEPLDDAVLGAIVACTLLVLVIVVAVVVRKRSQGTSETEVISGFLCSADFVSDSAVAKAPTPRSPTASTTDPTYGSGSAVSKAPTRRSPAASVTEPTYDSIDSVEKRPRASNHVASDYEWPKSSTYLVPIPQGGGEHGAPEYEYGEAAQARPCAGDYAYGNAERVQGIPPHYNGVLPQADPTYETVAPMQLSLLSRWAPATTDSDSRIVTSVEYADSRGSSQHDSPSPQVGSMGEREAAAGGSVSQNLGGVSGQGASNRVDGGHEGPTGVDYRVPVPVRKPSQGFDYAMVGDGPRTDPTAATVTTLL